jgi:hypothetical protein
MEHAEDAAVPKGYVAAAAILVTLLFEAATEAYCSSA